MEITKDTRLMDILKEYPWMEKELPEKVPAAKALLSPVGKLFLKKATIGSFLWGRRGALDTPCGRELTIRDSLKHKGAAVCCTIVLPNKLKVATFAVCEFKD